jgi:hypothetical protein
MVATWISFGEHERRRASGCQGFVQMPSPLFAGGKALSVQGRDNDAAPKAQKLHNRPSEIRTFAEITMGADFLLCTWHCFP